MAGALTERDFVAKLEKAGFERIEVLHREPMSLDDASLYPLFTDDLLALMRQLLPPERQQAVATAVVLRARRAARSAGTEREAGAAVAGLEGAPG